MRISDFLVRELGRRQVVLFFLLATMLYILPLILADFPYIDDNWRTLAAGNAWAGQGRLFMDWLYQALTFTGAAPNIFPLPLLLATVAMSFALTRLTFHYFPEPTVACCLVPLPLWYNPFLLQNLSYQYDGAGMALSLVAVIYAITFCGASRIQRWLVPSALLALAIGLYQISLNVFLGLCCLELLRNVHRRVPWSELWHQSGWRLAQLLLAVLIYSVTAYPFTDHGRTQLLKASADPLLQIGINIARVMEKVALLFHGGYTAVFIALVLCAVIGAVQLGRQIRERHLSRAKGLLLSFSCLLAMPLIVLLVPGMTLLFRDFNEGARTLMGFGVLLMLLFYLAYVGLTSLHSRLPLLLAIPLLATLSLSFAYGRVLMMEKTFANSALFSLSQDISSHRELREAKRIYLSVTYSDRWLAGAEGTFKQLPVLRYLLNIDYFMLAENLPSAGITNVVAERERRNATRVGYQGFPALVDRLYYRIYLTGDYGFIVMKEPPHGRLLSW
ncbi:MULTISPECIES: glucosyltransferase domain-containing protein [Pseudomonas]|uniref:Putative O-antigen conversion protein putative Glycosyltransferase n=1 Tax=Pseudomonas fluorescens (strain Pf0-1) TaxID=205922 RepID=Q3K7F7_PSEPF|nr:MULTISPECIES: glucosyltransferase domain-containing protein [Pseudomonas]ABA76297.1 putative O-antigen conversion protein putative Glycosyltransferase [Pseudomonas fluorescens Pf0-1]MBL0794156.1 glucosyltransferase domain-containing protein [Pseudomonas sp. B7]MBY9024226.1 glucosyltransferase domain-containing protein [Pseudomonas fluorescens]MBY9030539.1 glucosyltransferase domain-containing protein [Pseudomonas fluorescens]MBY9035857.1 glucosyltransferase domain-containing protein [Pseudo